MLELITFSFYYIPFTSLLAIFVISYFYNPFTREVTIEIVNLPSQECIVLINGYPYIFKGNIIKLNVQGNTQAIFCPRIINNILYIPNPYRVVLNYPYIRVYYTPSRDLSALRYYKECERYARYTSITSPSYYYYTPSSYSYPTSSSAVTSTSPSNPYSNWNPNIWIGKELYGYRVVSILGSGGNGYVLKVALGDRTYAMKVLSVTRSKESAEKIFDHLFQESDNLKNLSQKPNFVNIYGIYLDFNMIREALNGNTEAYLKYPPAIVMEFMEGGSVDKLISDQPYLSKSQYWPYIVKNIMYETAVALSYLHNSGYVHLDVKPQNIFLKKVLGYTDYEILNNVKGNVKLGDLGSAAKIKGEITQITPAYSPPDQIEAVIYNTGADPKMDIFALGMTGYTLLNGKNDYQASHYISKSIDSYNEGKKDEAIKMLEQAKQVLSNWVPQLPQNTPIELKEVILSALSLNPNNRPTADYIVSKLK